MLSNAASASARARLPLVSARRGRARQVARETGLVSLRGGGGGRAVGAAGGQVRAGGRRRGAGPELGSWAEQDRTRQDGRSARRRGAARLGRLSPVVPRAAVLWGRFALRPPAVWGRGGPGELTGLWAVVRSVQEGADGIVEVLH